MTKFTLIFTLLTLGLWAESDLPQKPNIIFILADDLSRDHLGAYGAIDCNTPHIDKLAKEGMRFNHAYASVAMCAPFRQELYSGRSPWRTGTLANHSKSKEGTKSLPHYLHPLGYEVAIMGKTHVGPKQAYPFNFIEPGGSKHGDRNPSYLESTQVFLNKRSEDKKPFCLFICSNDSHAPFTTGDRSQYDPEKFTIQPYWIDTPNLRDRLVEYYAEVSNFDALVGMIRSELEGRNLWDSTLFIVCSEQGSQLPFAKWTVYGNGLGSGLIVSWPGVVPAGSTMDELVSIADIAPTLVEAVGGSSQPGDFDGESFLPALRGEAQTLHEYVYGAFTNRFIKGNRDRIYPKRVIRNKSFSLIYNPNYKNHTSNITLDEALEWIVNEKPHKGKGSIATSWVKKMKEDPSFKSRVMMLNHRPQYELYNLEKDPYELNNEIANPEYAKILEVLKKQLHRKLAELGDSDPIATENSTTSGKG